MSARPAQRAESNAVRLGFLGLGWIGRKRLDAAAEKPHVAIAALADSDPARLDAALERYPHARPASDLRALCECDLDGVVIATPNAVHAPQAIACLTRGMAVFCQKPLGVNARECAAVIQAARAADRLLEVDYCYRRVAGMGELRRRIAAGELGEILAMDCAFHNAYGPDKPWAYDVRLSGGGALLDLGVHLVDLALWLTGDASFEVVSSALYASGAPLDTRDDVEDMAIAELRSERGASVRLACSWNAHAGRDAVIGLDVFGSRGGAAWRNVDGSFYDFTLDVFHGRAAERIASPPDEWGARALDAWIGRLRANPAFDEEALLVGRGAELIDDVYRCALADAARI